jgi:cholesterol oxidase
MKPISRPLSEMNGPYDAIVIGSGYGGGVAASRLARMGYRVALLERGEEIQPGNYPDTPAEAVARSQIHAGDINKGRGGELFDFHVGDGINVLVGSGLGGTSLINANVALPADRRVFEDPVWPADFTNDADLEEGYRRAKAMLRPAPYAPDGEDIPYLNKLDAMRKAASAMGATLDHPPINVNFKAGHNAAGVFQPACNFCGDCCSGCNVGAKNTTLMNYLPDAAAHEAEIFCGARVRWIERHDRAEGGRTETAWTVAYDPIGLGREAFAAAPLLVSANIVVLGAGTLGSTEILLRSRARGLALSPTLGSRFSGNGDVLAFGYNNDQPIDGIGLGWRAAAYDWKKDETRPVGPTITGLIDLRAAGEGLADVEKGMVIEEGSIPGGIGNILPAVMAAAAAAFGRDSDPGDMLSERARELESLARGPYHGAINHGQTFLVMSHDGDAADGIAAHGTLALDANDRLSVAWPRVGEKTGFRRVEERLRQAVAATGGTYVPNPVWTPILGRGLITVHPLGGCPMGRHAAAGVVDADCRVYDGIDGTDVHPGLYVCDGAVMPRSLGVNPLLTISAVAERAMIRLAEREARPFLVGSLPPRDESAVGAPTIGIRFTEKMTGEATAAAGGAPSPLHFVVTVVAPDARRLIGDKEHQADLIGTVIMPALSGDPLTVENGRWNLFVDDDTAVETRKMIYDMPLVTADGQKTYHFYGEKRIHDDPGFDLWSDATTLFVVLRDRDRTGPVLFEGVLGIPALDFVRQLGTMNVTGAPTLAARAKMLAEFGLFFGGKLFDTFGGPFARPDFYDPDLIRVKRPLRTRTPEVHHFETADKKMLRLTRYQGGEKGPVLLSHGLGVSSLIFSIDTIDTSLLEYLYAGGYDVWLLDYRASIALNYTQDPFTADDVADKDYPAAIDKVLELTGKPDLQFLGHCYGAMTFAMGMLDGSVKKVRSVVISQIAAHADVPFFTQRLLAHLRAPNLMGAVGVKWLDARAVRKRNIISRGIDAFLRFLYPRHPDDRTRSITSLRIAALYGPLYRLDRLNRGTLDAMPEMFGKANIAAFRQLAHIARKGTVQRVDGRPLLGEANLKNWAIPTLFVHGALNGAFRPSGTLKTMAALEQANGKGLYSRVEIPATGHIDCIFGKDAVRTVFPAILAHLDRTA